MFHRICSLILATFLVGISHAPAQEAKDQRKLVDSIVEAWRSRQAHINTVTCEAAVDSFYPKGSLSELDILLTGKKTGLAYPAQDQQFKAEKCLWAIDFAESRIRKESSITVPFCDRGNWTLAPDASLKLFANGNFRFFRPRERNPNKGATRADVTLYESASHDFVLAAADLPLIWLAGAVNGKWPNPHRLRTLESPKRFTYRAATEWSGHKCIILTVPEQNSGTRVREYWVGAEAPFLIHFCRARSGNSTIWKVEVDYRIQQGVFVLKKWSHTEYNHPGSGFRKSTFFVKDITINSPLKAEWFEKKLTPGMIVRNVEKGQFLEVDFFGYLVPMGTANSTWFWIYTGIGVTAVFVILLVVLRIARKRRIVG